MSLVFPNFYILAFLQSVYTAYFDESIQPILMSINDNEVRDNLAILLSDAKRPVERPKKNRVENMRSSPKRKMKCSRCVYENHNKSICIVNMD